MKRKCFIRGNNSSYCFLLWGIFFSVIAVVPSCRAFYFLLWLIFHLVEHFLFCYSFHFWALLFCYCYYFLCGAFFLLLLIFLFFFFLIIFFSAIVFSYEAFSFLLLFPLMEHFIFCYCYFSSCGTFYFCYCFLLWSILFLLLFLLWNSFFSSIVSSCGAFSFLLLFPLWIIVFSLCEYYLLGHHKHSQSERSEAHKGVMKFHRTIGHWKRIQAGKIHLP